MRLSGRMGTPLNTSGTNEKPPAQFGEGEGEQEEAGKLRGEGFGAGIQKAGGDYVENGTDVSFIIFDINIDGFDLKRESVNDIASRLGIPSVPVVFHGTLDEAKAFVASHPMSTLNGGRHEMEGLVLVPCVQLYDAKHHLIKCKCKYRDMVRAGLVEEK